MAWKSVFFNFKQYVWFFAAIFIVQMFYGLISVSASNNNTVEFEHVQDEYSYHIVMRDVEPSQYGFIHEREADVVKSERHQYFTEYRTEQYTDAATGAVTYDLYIQFREDSKLSDYSKFYEKYITPFGTTANDEDYLDKVEETPLISFEKNIQANRATFLVISAVLLAVSVYLLMSLYNIRINQYKFEYGVRMTFGADFKMLFGSAFWELFIISLVTIIPALIASTVTIGIIYATQGLSFGTLMFSFLSSSWKVALFSLIVVLASVWTPMRVMSIRQPMSLIRTEDNSNLVSSPRRSFNLLGKKFPLQYELYSIWRFRKYNIQLLTTAIVFCALFICGLYLANVYTTGLEYKRPQFTIDLTQTDVSYDEQMDEELSAIDGVKIVETNDNKIEARYIESHVLVKPHDIKAFAGLINYKGKNGNVTDRSYRVTNDVLYKAITEEQLKYLSDESAFGYEIVGNPSDVLINDGTKRVIVGDSISNMQKFKFDVGDVIAIGRKVNYKAQVDNNLNGRALLRKQIENYDFEYTFYTICAIIKDIPSGSVPMYFTPDDYEALQPEMYTGDDLDANSHVLNIYVDQSLTTEQVTDIEMQIREDVRIYGKVNVTNLHQISNNSISHDKHYTELYICISILILLISPLVWFFSQTLYYYKREKEFNIIQSMGALGPDIRKIYLLGGLSMAIMSFVVSILLSYVASYAMFYVINVVVPQFSNEYVRYTFYMPWYAILTSVLMSVACGFFSVYFPYRSYFKYRYSLQNGGSGEFGDAE